MSLCHSISEFPPINHTHFVLPGAGGPRTVTIEELKERTKVTDSQLDTEIKETDMIILAAHFDNVDTYPVQLGLRPAEQSDIRIAQLVNGTQTAMDKALRLWRQHNPGAATYRALVMIVLRTGKVDVATEVCKFLARKYECESTAVTLGGGADSRPTLGGGELDEGESGPPKKKI